MSSSVGRGRALAWSGGISLLVIGALVLWHFLTGPRMKRPDEVACAASAKASVALVATSDPRAGAPVGNGCAWEKKTAIEKKLVGENPADGSGAKFCVAVHNGCSTGVDVEFRLVRGPLKCVVEQNGKWTRTDKIPLGVIPTGQEREAHCYTGPHEFITTSRRTDEYILLGKIPGSGPAGRYDPQVVLERSGEPTFLSKFH